MRQRWTAGVGAALLLVACGSEPVSANNSIGAVASQACNSCGGDCRLDTIEITDSSHTTDPIDYPDRPPAGGPHNPCWTTWGVHTNAVPDDNWVHNLEHGGVVFLYNCPSGCATDVAALTSYVQSLGNRGVLTPYSDMDWTYAAVAWGHRLLANCLDMTALQQFYTDHVNQAPEQELADPPSSCP